ncbi:ABC transporter permease, partial [Dickeya sp. DW 0440]
MRERLSSYGPSLRQQVSEPLESLRLLGRRAVLALLGIAVGCAAVVALMNIGHNAEAQAMAVFRNMGSDVLVATVHPPAGSQMSPYPASVPDMRGLADTLPDIRSLSALTITSLESRIGGRSINTLLAGVNPALASVLDLQLAQGRFLSEFDTNSTHAVIGAHLVEELAAKGVAVAPGTRVQLGGYLFQI